MGNRATARQVLGLLVACASLGTPLAVFAESRSQTVQVMIIIPERRTPNPSLAQVAQLPSAPPAMSVRAAVMQDTLARLADSSLSK